MSLSLIIGLLIFIPSSQGQWQPNGGNNGNAGGTPSGADILSGQSAPAQLPSIRAQQTPAFPQNLQQRFPQPNNFRVPALGGGNPFQRQMFQARPSFLPIQRPGQMPFMPPRGGLPPFLSLGGRPGFMPLGGRPGFPGAPGGQGNPFLQPPRFLGGAGAMPNRSRRPLRQGLGGQGQNRPAFNSLSPFSMPLGTGPLGQTPGNVQPQWTMPRINQARQQWNRLPLLRDQNQGGAAFDSLPPFSFPMGNAGGLPFPTNVAQWNQERVTLTDAVLPPQFQQRPAFRSNRVPGLPQGSLPRWNQVPNPSQGNIAGSPFTEVVQGSGATTSESLGQTPGTGLPAWLQGNGNNNPFMIGQGNPLGAGQANPLGAGQANPLGAGQPNPLGAGQPNPLGTGQPNPLGAGQGNPLGTGQPNPLGLGNNGQATMFSLPGANPFGGATGTPGGNNNQMSWLPSTQAQPQNSGVSELLPGLTFPENVGLGTGQVNSGSNGVPDLSALLRAGSGSGRQNVDLSSLLGNNGNTGGTAQTQTPLPNFENFLQALQAIESAGPAPGTNPLGGNEGNSALTGGSQLTGNHGNNPFGGLPGLNPSGGGQGGNPFGGAQSGNPFGGAQGRGPLGGPQGNNQFAGLQGNTPQAGNNGNNPFGGLPGANPLDGTQGINPFGNLPGNSQLPDTQGLPGMNPSGGEQGSNPFAGLPGMNPSGGEQGSNPFAGLRGMNPSGGGQGSNPFAGLLGMNPSGGGQGSNPLGGLPGMNSLPGGQGNNPFAGLPPMNPSGGGQGSNPFGGLTSMNPSGGGQGNNPFAGILGMNPSGGGQGSNPFGGLPPMNPSGGGQGNNPFAGIPDMNPSGGGQGSNPLGGLPGMNPLPGGQGSNPFAGIPGMNLFGNLPGGNLTGLPDPFSGTPNFPPFMPPGFPRLPEMGAPNSPNNGGGQAGQTPTLPGTGNNQETPGVFNPPPGNLDFLQGLGSSNNPFPDSSSGASGTASDSSGIFGQTSQPNGMNPFSSFGIPSQNPSGGGTGNTDPFAAFRNIADNNNPSNTRTSPFS
ncbi:collagen alpha-1(IV) chain-like isoform X22 [Ostrea edulis]|uniref:collagen alpha-1(IV) chain-like isoform X22 n=1 Tax=Ostrea edulis TaxID=37623 RepID=UPI0024AF6209|nr:collagen alpha-1(IV) chain-like isoform X22 [Ostrea edulis]